MSRVYTRERLGLTSPVIRATGPRITTVDPAFGDEAGGDSVSIFGANLNGVVSAVSIGDAVASFEHINDRQIDAVTAAGTGTDDVVVTIGGKVITLADGFEYIAGGASDLVFASYFSNGTGEGDAAVGDGGLWAVENSGDDRLTVVSAAGLDFPAGMTNVLHIRYRSSPYTPANGRPYCAVGKEDMTTAPSQVGDKVFYRYYFRSEVTVNPGYGSHHPVQSAFEAGDCPGVCSVNHAHGSTFSWHTANLSMPTYDDTHRWFKDSFWGASLSANKTYRAEWCLEKAGAESYKLSVRIYDSSDVLLADDDDFVCNINSHNHTLADWNASPGNNINSANVGCIAHLWLTHQGDWNVTDEDGNRIWYGGVAASETQWCGPWIDGEGP